MNRHDKLLAQIAVDLEDGKTALNEDFLSRNNIGPDECTSLSETMAAILTGYIRSPKEVRTCIIAAGTLIDMPATMVWETYITQNQYRNMQNLTNKIAGFNPKSK